MISKLLLEELKIIIKEDYGVLLPPDALEELANTLVSFFEVFWRVSKAQQESEK